MRAELLGQILNAQFDLDSVSAARDGAPPAQAEAQRHELAALLRTISVASAATLPAMRSQIVAALSGSANVVQQARAEAAAKAAAPELTAAAATSRAQVQSLMRDLHRFDPYLQFASPDEEAEYRRRESERRGYIEQQHARGTPQGDLSANAAALGQLVDAEAHGAGASPAFNRHRDALAGSYERLRIGVRENGGSTREADATLERDVRRALRRRGHSDKQIDALFAAQGGDPLAVMRAEQGQVPPAAQTVAELGAPMPPPQHLADAMAALRAAGVVAAPPSSEIESAAPTPQQSTARAPAAGRS